MPGLVNKRKVSNTNLSKARKAAVKSASSRVAKAKATLGREKGRDREMKKNSRNTSNNRSNERGLDAATAGVTKAKKKKAAILRRQGK